MALHGGSGLRVIAGFVLFVWLSERPGVACPYKISVHVLK